MNTNPHILDQDQATELLGYGSPGMTRSKLRKQGIEPVDGARGRWFITLQQIAQAKGKLDYTPEEEDRIRI